MDVRRSKTPSTSVTRNLDHLYAPTGNIYETIVILAKRANQINVELKHELNSKLDDFSSYQDNLEEVFENKEQIELSRYYEKLPKSSLVALQEFLDNKIYFRSPVSGAESVTK